MTTNLGDFFDTYSLRARLQPAFLTLLPAVAAVYGLWQPPGLQKIWLVFVAAGGTFFLANFVRSRGLDVETRLIRDWDGWPTTHALRLRTPPGNAILRDRRRARLQVVTGVRLPSLDDELADPRGADEIYEAATRVLISKVREHPDVFRRVQEENTSYGFRRNLYALRPLALAVLAIVTVACVVVGIEAGVTGEIVLVVLIDMLGALAWIFVIKPDWVRQVGERYSERLFEALESDVFQQSR